MQAAAEQYPWRLVPEEGEAGFSLPPLLNYVGAAAPASEEAAYM